MNSETNKIVLQKFIAGSGHCSRRNAEELIREGRVLLNGKKPKLGDRADDSDKVEVDGKVLKSMSEKVYILVNKPIGYTCTSRSFKNEKNIFELMPVETHSDASLHAVGRLDKNSKGLVLLTNDGELTQKLTHPKYGHEKEYYATITNYDKSRVKSILDALKTGVDIGEGDGVVKSKKIEYVGDGEFRIILTEGKKRQIRRMFRAVGFSVMNLTRTRIGKLSLGDLEEGECRNLKRSEIRKLKE